MDNELLNDVEINKEETAADAVNDAKAEESVAEAADAAASAQDLAEAAKKPVTKDMNIKYILSLHPQSSVILMSIGMGCITCFAAEMESLAEACIVHGLDPDDVTEYLNAELGLLVPSESTEETAE